MRHYRRIRWPPKHALMMADLIFFRARPTWISAEDLLQLLTDSHFLLAVNSDMRTTKSTRVKKLPGRHIPRLLKNSIRIPVIQEISLRDHRDSPASGQQMKSMQTVPMWAVTLKDRSTLQKDGWSMQLCGSRIILISDL